MPSNTRRNRRRSTNYSSASTVKSNRVRAPTVDGREFLTLLDQIAEPTTYPFGDPKVWTAREACAITRALHRYIVKLAPATPLWANEKFRAEFERVVVPYRNCKGRWGTGYFGDVIQFVATWKIRLQSVALATQHNVNFRKGEI
jgi:hypothetical protein